MRLGHSYVEDRDARAGQIALPRDRDAFAAHMRYDQETVASREAFLATTAQPWVIEVRAALRELLDPDRAALSIGSGRGEHEVALHLEGYDIVASDLVDDALDDACRLFPGFRAMRFDVLAPDVEEAMFDDLLATGIDHALDDDQLRTLFASARRITRPGGRVILVHRYRDSVVTRLVDQVLLPAWALSRNLRRGGTRLVRRQHGWRRTRSEIRALARECGYDTGRVRHAAFAMELARLPVPRGVLRAVARVDRRLHAFSSATVFEFLPAR
jgi:SAM-dependent methyltransferase